MANTDTQSQAQYQQVGVQQTGESKAFIPKTPTSELSFPSGGGAGTPPPTTGQLWPRGT